ncbi:hypothetical protein [Paraburkholderia hospita]|uniref:hypothetical protein n=1 Tax=Paraburkholderia hospita TaxID=169430 RepID=UPI000B349C9E|nr:hypothetical protein [Paraburkholderia hospita]OUL79956.1 hypothetical protein CA603_32695 [Paraburkholderia hospita]
MSDTTRGRLVHKQRQANGSFDVYEPADGVREEFADGFANVMVGAEVSRVSFFTTVAIEAAEPQPGQPLHGYAPDQVEVRMVNSRMVMPTRALIDFCLTTLRNVKLNAPQLEAGRNQVKTTVTDALDALK